MTTLQQTIETAWENRELLKEKNTQDAIRKVIDLLDAGNYAARSLLALDGK